MLWVIGAVAALLSSIAIGIAVEAIVLSSQGEQVNFTQWSENGN